MHLKQPGFTYSPWGPFTMNKERIQRFIQTGNKKLYLLKWSWLSLFSTWYGLW